MLLHTLFLPTLFAQVALFPGVLGRRGSGSSDYDSSDSSSTDTSSSSSSSNDDTCGTPEHPSIAKWSLIPNNVENYTSDASQGRSGTPPNIYDGSFFQGVGSLSWSIREHQSLCRSEAHPAPIRLLGYAWVGPQPPYPKGPTNPFIVGFMGWASEKPLDEINDSYGYIKWNEWCPLDPDLVHIVTTRGWDDFDIMSPRAEDILHMTTTTREGSGNDTAVRFNGTAVPDLDPALQSDQGKVAVPGWSCHSDYPISLGWSARMRMSGRITNTTIELSIVGEGTGMTSYENYVGADDEVHVSFNVTFSGTFDGANSTEALVVPGEDGELIGWQVNGATQLRDVTLAGIVLVGLVGLYLL